MGPLRAFKYDADSPGAPVDDETAAELRRLAYLFLLSGVTLALFLLRALVETLPSTALPSIVIVASGVILLTGWIATLAYGIFVTFTARRWGWVLLCLIPLTCVPAAVAYAVIRRGEIERAVLGDGPERPR